MYLHTWTKINQCLSHYPPPSEVSKKSLFSGRMKYRDTTQEK